MSKFKKVLISISVSVLVILISNYIFNKFFNESYMTVFVTKEEIKKGDVIDLKKIEKVKIKKEKSSHSFIEKEKFDLVIETKVAKLNISKGQIIDESIIEDSVEHLYIKENLELACISIDAPENILSYQLEKGNTINIYYTAKLKEVSNITGKFKKIYSSSESDGLVTLKLYEKIEVVGAYDNVGKKVKKGEMMKQIMISVDKEDAILLSMLKNKGKFDVTLSD